MDTIKLFAIILPLIIYGIIESIVLFLIPKSLRKKKDISGQKVLITGAGSGLGRQLAIQFSKHGTCLILLDINKVSLTETAQLVDRSSRVFIYECDVTNRKMVYAVAQKIKVDNGDIDILVNNAGIVCGKSLIDLPDEQIIKTMEVNTISHFWICKSFLPAMMANNSGHIVTVSSIAGFMGTPKLTDYCASKFASIGFAEALEAEVRIKNLDGIKVTIVCPLFMDTGLFDGVKVPLLQILSADYVAKEIVDAVQEEKETICFPKFIPFLLIFNQMVSRRIRYISLKALGNSNSMEHFRGRPSIAENTK